MCQRLVGLGALEAEESTEAVGREVATANGLVVLRGTFSFMDGQYVQKALATLLPSWRRR